MLYKGFLYCLATMLKRYKILLMFYITMKRKVTYYWKNMKKCKLARWQQNQPTSSFIEVPWLLSYHARKVQNSSTILSYYEMKDDILVKKVGKGKISRWFSEYHLILVCSWCLSVVFLYRKFFDLTFHYLL